MSKPEVLTAWGLNALAAKGSWRDGGLLGLSRGALCPQGFAALQKWGVSAEN